MELGDGGEDGQLNPEKYHEEFRNRHQKEATRLRTELEELTRQAKAILHGQEQQSRPPRPPANGKRAEREKELEAALEKVNWYRHEIKRLRSDLASWDNIGGGPGNLVGAQDRDPMEAYNLLVERRKELQRLQRNGQGLDKVAAAQKRAEAEQNALSPEIEERLRRKKEEVAQQKRLNIRLQADRQKVDEARKKAEHEVRLANNDVRSKASQLKRPPRPGNNSASGGAAEAEVEQKKLRNLQRDVDILTSAIRQDERKFKAAEREDEQQLEMTRRQIAKLTADIAGHEAEIAKLRVDLKQGPRQGDPQPESSKFSARREVDDASPQEAPKSPKASREEILVPCRSQVSQEELDTLASQVEELATPRREVLPERSDTEEQPGNTLSEASVAESLPDVQRGDAESQVNLLSDFFANINDSSVAELQVALEDVQEDDRKRMEKALAAELLDESSKEA